MLKGEESCFVMKNPFGGESIFVRQNIFRSQSQLLLRSTEKQDRLDASNTKPNLS
jgi:hypothetical protein